MLYSQVRTDAKACGLARADLIIHSRREIEVLFSSVKNSPFSLALSIKLQLSALVISPCFIPRHRCEKSARESRNSHHLIKQRDNIHARTHDTCVIRADICRQDGAICSKNRKIVPYHRCARILRLTVSIPDYSSWIRLILANFELVKYCLLYYSQVNKYNRIKAGSLFYSPGKNYRWPVKTVPLRIFREVTLTHISTFNLLLRNCYYFRLFFILRIPTKSFKVRN